MASRVPENLATIKPGTLFAGVDVARQTHVVTVITGQARRVGRFTFANTRAGFETFFRRLEALRRTHRAPEVIVAMEPSGSLWMPLAQAVEERHGHYVLVNAYTVHQRRQGDALDRAKDDWRDSATIAELARTGVFTQTRLLSERYAALRHLGQRLEVTAREIARHKNRLHADIAVVFPEFFTVFKDMLGLTAQAVLEHDVVPAHIAQADPPAWVAGVRRVFRGQRLSLTHLAHLRAAAVDSIAVRAGAGAYQGTIRRGLQTLRLLYEEQQELQQAIRDQVAQVPGHEQALTIPGMCPLTLGRILGHIGDPTRFHKARQLVKLAGIQPTPNASGQRRGSRTPMSRQGRSGLRTVLFFASLRVIHADPSFRQAYQRLQERPTHPLCKMEALGAMMNKLIRIIWTLLVRGLPYDPPLAFAA
jgi:transposase